MAKNETTPEELDELEELEELEEAEPDKPKAKKKKAKGKKATPSTWGTRELSEYLAEETGTEYKPKDLRVLLRKMAAEDELDWEVKQGTGKRYSWAGPDDPEVQRILERVASGEIEEARKAALDKLKKDQEAKRAAKKAEKEAAEAEEVEELEDDDIEEFEELDDEEDE